MAAALAQGGTSFDSLYVDVAGSGGYFERSLHAYGREGEPCDRCGTPIVREQFMNRSSHSCPVCQRKCSIDPVVLVVRQSPTRLRSVNAVGSPALGEIGVVARWRR